MEALLIIGAIWLIIFVYNEIKDSVERKKNIRQHQNRNYQSPSQGIKQNQVRSPLVYRPSSHIRSSNITFKRNNNKQQIIQKDQLVGLNDAFTGEPLKVDLGLHQCLNCHVYYHTSSLEIINSENSGKCVACLSKKIINIKEKEKYPSGRNYNAEVVTLENYKQHVGYVITFEDYVHRINVSRDGRSYAVMFENKSWRYGLKMIVFRGSVKRIGGSKFLRELQGRTIRIRGLLNLHETFGYQIIISERSMILDIQ